MSDVVAPGAGQDNTATTPVTPPAPQPAPVVTEPVPPANPAPEPAKPAEFNSMLGEKPAEPVKPGEVQPEGDKGKPDEPAWDIKLPEGATADKEAMDFLKGLVKDGGMSKEAAQKAADTHMAALQRYEAWRAAEGQKQIDAWEGEVKAHPEFGGVNLDKSVDAAKRMLQKYGSPKLVTDFQRLGVLSHPELAYMLMRMSKDVSEGESIGGAGHVMPETNPAKILYPNMN